MTITQIVGLVVVVLLAALGIFFVIKKSEKHTLIKLLSIFILLSVALTWIFSSGLYNGASFVDNGLNKLGLTDLPNMIYYAMNFAGDKIIFLLALGCFYAVLSRVENYKKLVKGIAEKLKGKEIIFVLVSSLLFTIMAALFTQSFITLLFVPFVVSIALSMKLDKISAFCVTFGSILIGVLGSIYGGEGLQWFNYYTGLTYETAMIYRLIVLVVAFILFNLFTVLRVKKVVLDKKVNEIEADPFMVEKVDKKAKSWPIIVIFSLLFIIMVLGYTAWDTNFKIECFKNFHTWLMELKIGEFEIFKNILGNLAETAPFGAWNLYHMATLLVVISIGVAIMGGVKLDEFISSYKEGINKISKSALLFVGIYIVMIAGYLSTYVPTITNLMFDGVSKFNPYLVSLMAFISNTIYTDFGFTGYIIGTFFVSTYAESVEVLHFIFTSTYGLLQFFVPTSAFLLIGLSYLNIDYKSWMKHIWIFLVAILVILLILFTILAYI